MLSDQSVTAWHRTLKSRVVFALWAGLLLSSAHSAESEGQPPKEGVEGAQPGIVDVESSPPVVEEGTTESLVTPFIVPFGSDEKELTEEQGGRLEEESDLLETEIIESLDPDPLPLEELSAPPVESSPVSVGSQAVLPSGFFSRTGRSGATSGGGVSGLFSLSAYSEAAHESNPSFGVGSQGVQGSDGYILLGGEINFQREIREFEVELSYYGDYQHYFKKGSLSNDFHEADLAVKYAGAAVEIGLRAGVTKGSGANAYYATLVKQTSWQVGLTGNYQVSALTEIRAGYDYTAQDASARLGGGAAVNDTRGHTLSVDALWAYSPLLKIGPGMRLTERIAEASGSLKSLGPSVNLDYELTEIVSLDATAAFNWYEVDSQQRSGNGFSAKVGGVYAPSTLWSVSLSLGREVVANTSVENAFVERTSCRVGFRRNIGRNSVNLGLSCNFDNPLEGSSNGSAERDFYALDLSLSREVFEESEASVFVNWRDLSTEELGGNSLVVGVSLNHKF